MKITRTLVIVLLAALLPAPLAGQAPANATAAVDRIFQPWNSQETPGCAVGVTREGRAVLSRAYGMADLEHGIPNSPNTIFESGSVAKQFTAGAIVLLALDGKLSLDDDVRKYVPEVPDYGTPLTIRHLLSHTSGLRDWGSVASISGWGRGERSHNHAHVLDIVSRQSALNYTPGAAYSYTNTGFNLLAIIVSRVSGTSFAEFSKMRIFEPLGMRSTQWRDDYTRIVKGRSTAYSGNREDGFSINRPIEYVHGNGGLLTTVGDLLLWTENLQTGKLGGPEFQRLMHQKARLNDGREIFYASGLQVGTYNGVPQVSHGGSTAGYRAYLTRFPEQRLAVALLCNVASVNPGGLAHQVADVFLGNAARPVAAQRPQGVPVPGAQLQARAGLYRETRTGEPLRLIVEDGQLRVDEGPALTPLSASTFQVGSDGERFEFQPAAGGARGRISVTTDGYSDGTYEPVEEFRPSPVQLAEYAGTYHSDDAETTLIVGVENSRLVAWRRPDARFSFTPIYPDAFDVRSLGLMRFIRDRQGRIVELSLRQGRVHDLRLQRLGL